jgi:hypothetical protein
LAGKKYDLSAKKPLRPPAPIRKYPLTGGAEAPTGSQTGRGRDAAAREAPKTETDEAGRAQKKVAQSVRFCLSLFEIDGD